MTNKEAIHKLEYSKKAYQMLIDEKVDSGKFVGKDVEGEWKADTPLDEAYKSMIEALDLAIKALEIELLTDKEQRIFLKAINREREVCQKVDDEYSDDDSKVSLVKVCNSIERKVKKIWE